MATPITSLVQDIKDELSRQQDLPPDPEQQTRIPINENYLLEWTERTKNQKTPSPVDDGNSGTPEHLMISKLDSEFEKFIKFLSDIILKAEELQIQFGHEKYDTEQASTYENLIYSHPLITSDVYESALPVLEIKEVTYQNQTNKFWQLFNFIYSYSLDGSGDSEQQDLITFPLSSRKILLREFKVRPPVAYRHKEVEMSIDPLLVLPNIESRLSESFDPTQKHTLINLVSGYSVINVLKTIVFIKVMELFSKETILGLILLDNQTYATQAIVDFLKDNDIEDFYSDKYEQFINISSKLGILSWVVDVLRRQLLKNVSIEEILLLFQVTDDEILVHDEIKNLFFNYDGLKKALGSIPSTFVNGITSKSVVNYRLQGVFTVVDSETFQITYGGSIDKTEKRITNTPTIPDVLVKLNPIHRRIVVNQNGQPSIIKIRIDADQGKVFYEIENPGQPEAGIRTKPIYLTTSNWDDAISIAKQLNEQYGNLVYKSVSGLLQGELEAGVLQQLLNSSLNMNLSFDNTTRRGNISFSGIFKKPE